jgi:hypothetical protein
MKRRKYDREFKQMVVKLSYNHYIHQNLATIWQQIGPSVKKLPCGQF